jgi:hypothetical protein
MSRKYAKILVTTLCNPEDGCKIPVAVQEE